jgi:hypothetical protein
MRGSSAAGRSAEPPDTAGQVEARSTGTAAGERDLGALGHPKKLAFLTAFGRVGNISEAAALAGVHRNAHYWWLSADDGYRDAFLEAHAAYCDRIEQEIRTRAIEGEEEPVFGKNGEQVGTRRKKSDLLLIFAAKGAMPHKYRDNAPLPAQPAPDVARLLDGLSREQMRELIDRLESGEGPPPEVIARVRGGEGPPPPPALPEPDDEG